MKQVPLIAGALAIALFANSVSAVWAKQPGKVSWPLFLMLLSSPLVFVSFGLVTARLGLAVGAGVIDSLLSVSTIAVGLILFREWDKVSSLQYLGMFLAFVGVALMLLFPKPLP
ncbi:MAG: hypothetical protein AAB320_00165 [Elusimicrobiota bacterium]